MIPFGGVIQAGYVGMVAPDSRHENGQDAQIIQAARMRQHPEFP
jgi:hypothetical protein